MREPPHGWVETRLEEITYPLRTGVNPADCPSLPYLGLEHVESGSTKILATAPASSVRSTSYQFERGSTLYARLRPYLNKVCTPDFTGIGSGEFIIFPPAQHIARGFLKYLFNQPRFVDFTSTLDTGDRPRVNWSGIGQFKFDLPPLAEQKRIVAAIEEQFSRLDAGVAALERVRLNLKRMRIAVLFNACSGALTAEWRKTHGWLSTGAKLMSEISAERAQRKVSGNAPKQVIQPSPVIPEGIPLTWTRVSIDQVCSFVTDGEHLTPPRTDEGVMLLSARNVQNGFLSFEVVDHVSEETYRDLSRRLEVTAGDVLLSCSGTVGRSAVVPPDVRFALVRSVAVLRPLRPIGEFITLMLRSPQVQQQINARKTETAQANIFQSQIRALTLPLPPWEEQLEIVKSVERFLSQISDLENSLLIEQKRAASLRSAILASAFSGNLVPQITTDEPATILLERITAERASSNGQRPSSKARQARLTA